MNIKYDTNLKVKDLEGENFSLVQNPSEVEAFNEEYDEDYTYYFIEWCDGCACTLFGADSIFNHNNVYEVAKFF